MARDKALPEADARDAEEEELKPQTFRLTFDDMLRTKNKPDDRSFVVATPLDVGIDIEEAGVPAGSTFSVVYRSFRPGENAEIREAVKDFPAETWLQELHDEICMRCLVEPAFPDTAEGRRQLGRWQPGFRSTVATAVQNLSGMGPHTIKDAKEELGKLQGLIRDTSSI